MNNDIKKEINSMISLFNDEIEENKKIVDIIKKLDNTTKALKEEIDYSQKSIEELFESFKFDVFKNGVDESLKNMKKTTAVLENIKNSMKEVEETKERFDRYNKELDEQYNKLLLSNQEKKEIIESLKEMAKNTESIKKNTEYNKKKLDYVSDEIKNCGEKIFKNKNEILERIKSNNSGENVVATLPSGQLPSEKSLMDRIDSLEEYLILAIENNKEEVLESIINKKDESPLKVDIDEEKIINSNQEIKEQLQNLEEKLSYTVENKMEEILDKKVNSILTKLLS